MNEDLDLEELLDCREILEAYMKIPANKRKECKERLIAIMNQLSEEHKMMA